MLSALHALISERNDDKTSTALKHFADVYFEHVAVDDLLATSADDTYGSLLSCWKFVQVRKPQEAKVRVYNPDFESYGWQSAHTVIEFSGRDMPFLIDSVRMYLNSQHLNIHKIHYCVMQVERNSKHQMKLSGLDKATKDSVAESIIHIEIDHNSSQKVLKALESGLTSVLAEVDACVSDFPEIMKRAKQTVKMVAKPACKWDENATKEAAEFMEWLCDNHFTFLASDEFTLEQNGDITVVNRDTKKDLGLFSYKKAGRQSVALQEHEEGVREFLLSKNLVSFMKSSNRSRVHRPAYPDYVVAKRYDKDGNVIGGVRFMGMFTSIVYIETPNNIPIIRDKLNVVRKMAGFLEGSHNSKEFNRILEVYPRDDLFQCSEKELLDTSVNILNIQERRQSRVYLRKDAYSKFITCMLYIPRDIYNTELRHRIESILHEEFEPIDIEFNTYFSESILARTQFTLCLDPSKENVLDEKMITYKLLQAVRSWSDDLHLALIEQVGEEKGNNQFVTYQHAFPAGYKENFGVRTAVTDIQFMETIGDDADNRLAMSFYRELESDDSELRFKLLHKGDVMPLSDVVPVLENLGLRVLGEQPYEIKPHDQESIHIHNFILQFTLSDKVDIAAVKQQFQEAFHAVWYKQSENDGFNRLVLGAGISWRDIMVLRAYARYMKQIKFGISQNYIASTLCRYIGISRLLVDYFHQRFDIKKISDEKRAEKCEKIEADILAALDNVEQLNEDLCIRRFLELMKATLRTNLHQTCENGKHKDYISFKINPHAISDMPLPRPMFEIFVYSTRVEGVHLRGGKVARGGLRWSDRSEDFRTEVLGLVKAQQVKNSVIVPVGAKGGFVAKCLPSDGDRDAFMAEGVRSYQTFISALLDVTDNLVDGAVVPPEHVVRHDEDDPYMVVAADKGTATFSDIANKISVDRGFWMGDGFASGGSIGYDHKKMGITARGAWVSVQRHFREQELNVQKTDFTVAGIGDMGGDVFGNGMLLSEHIQLVAAFNHMHIFIDPTPDSAKSFHERKRLFETPRSTWNDYDKKLISKGGGVFSRSAKSIPLSSEMKKLLDVSDDKLAPNQLISAILRAPVDLIWNGGIGTYIKATSESHANVGDKANDALRINANEVRAKVVGEGGNLGITQLARIEYGLHDGVSYTDFIDNSAGVDCSDHEVNIKIMLNDMVVSGDLTRKQRDQVFMDMTDDVAELVLNNNYKQTQAIALAYSDCLFRLDEYIRLMRDFEAQGKLDRSLEFLPDEETLQERRANGVGMTRPELSVLISYTKGDLKAVLNDASITDDAYLKRMVETAFPESLTKRYKDPVYRHRLCNEIVATQLANDLVNFMGITFVNRLKESTGASVTDIARAYVAARDMFSLPEIWQQIEQLDYSVSSGVQEGMMRDLMRLIKHTTRWLLKNRRGVLDIEQEVKRFKGGIQMIAKQLSSVLKGGALQQWRTTFEHREAAGVPKALAEFTAGCTYLYSALGIIEAAGDANCDVSIVSEAYFELGGDLQLNWFRQQINDLEVNTHWETRARETIRDDLDWQQRSLTVGMLSGRKKSEKVHDMIVRWKNEHEQLIGRWQRMMGEVQTVDKIEFALISVALRELLDLAQASHHKG